MTRWRLLFAVAVLVTLATGHVLRDTPGYMVRNPDGSLSGDITHYVYWSRLVTLGGIQSAYSGIWPETYAVYPPLTLLPLEAVGLLYRATQDPGFDVDTAQASLWLREAIKFTALAWHLLTGIALFLLLGGKKAGALAGTVYVLNPAALYDVAHWAQPDGAHSLFSVLAVGLLELGQVVAPWASLAAAAMAKPQAWFLGPLLLIATFRAHGARGIVRGLIASAVVAAVVALPFAVTGHLLELLTLPLEISQVMPVVSADAHNLWWIVLQLRGQDPIFLPDSARVVGPLTYRLVAAGLVGASMLLACWLYWTRRASLAECAALGVLGWFDFTTQAHENHLFFALPLLSLAWPRRQALLIPLSAMSLTLLLNMVLHDELVLGGVGLATDDPRVESLRLANACVNLACFMAWSLWAALRKASARTVVKRTPALGYSELVAIGLEAPSD